ncbi:MULTISPECIES: hypothetical protein [unclassified Bradyrhizobium]|uniref:hypothetical protein n=2 Tax=Bradyrhizobium TaxID=374 RepID=UPI0028EB6D1C|nr:MULTISPECIES: hypothetical protein [unclassified Bradyrhizobium]
MSIAELRDRLRDIPGIETMTMQTVMGRQLFGLNGKLIGVPVTADDAEIERVIRLAISSDKAGEIIPSPSAALLPELTQTKPEPRATMSGSFAASIKAMVDAAKADLEQAKADGLAEVQGAIGKLGEAKSAVKHVTGSMARSIHGQVDDIMAELGQITNDLGGDAQ